MFCQYFLVSGLGNLCVCVVAVSPASSPDSIPNCPLLVARRFHMLFSQRVSGDRGGGLPNLSVKVGREKRICLEKFAC